MADKSNNPQSPIPNPQSPIPIPNPNPNPQSPIPNPQSPIPNPNPNPQSPPNQSTDASGWPSTCRVLANQIFFFF